MKKLACLILACLMIFSLAACNTTTTPEETNNESPSATPENTPEQTPENTPENTPEQTPAPTEPPVSELKIAGTDISEFTIVYYRGCRLGENKLASALAEHIKNEFGVELTVKSDAADKTDHEIIIGQSSHVSEAMDSAAKALSNYKIDTANSMLFTSEGDLWVIASNAYNIEAAVLKLISDITPTKAGDKIDIDYSAGANVVAEQLGESLKIMSYNVQTGSADKVKPRVPKVVEHIMTFDADVIGTQEINFTWIAELTKLGFLNTYTRVGDARQGSSKDAGNEYSCIFFKTDKFNLIDSGTYWLSDTPNTISKLDSCDYYRIMTFAVLERKSDGIRFLHVNTHMEWDHGTVLTNLLQTNILLDLTNDILNKHGDMPVYFTGDFNVTTSSKGYAKMLEWGNEDSRNVAETSTTANTFSGGSIIDFCFVSKNDFVVKSFSVGSGYEGSDHYPVFVEFYILNK